MDAVAEFKKVELMQTKKKSLSCSYIRFVTFQQHSVLAALQNIILIALEEARHGFFAHKIGFVIEVFRIGTIVIHEANE